MNGSAARGRLKKHKMALVLGLVAVLVATPVLYAMPLALAGDGAVEAQDEEAVDQSLEQESAGIEAADAEQTGEIEALALEGGEEDLVVADSTSSQTDGSAVDAAEEVVAAEEPAATEEPADAVEALGAEDAPAEAAAVLQAGDVELNEANFPDEKFRAFLRDCYNEGESILSAEKIASMTRLDVYGSNLLITDLTGVEHFTNLETLLVKGNYGLTTLDVRALTNLKNLNCMGNGLVSIDVRGLTKLEDLNCSSNPALSSLSLGYLPSLRILRCLNGQLTSLDLSGLPNLKDFSCYGNKLTSLDLSALPKLRSLDCTQNKISTLDVTCVPDLAHVTFASNAMVDLAAGDDPSRSAFYGDYIPYGYGDQQVSIELIVNGDSNSEYRYVSKDAYSVQDNHEIQMEKGVYKSGHFYSKDLDPENFVTDLKQGSFKIDGVIAYSIKNVTVSFDSQGGSVVENQSFECGDVAAEPAVPTRDGYVFKGWTRDLAAPQAYDFRTAVMGDTTLYALWEQKSEDPVDPADPEDPKDPEDPIDDPGDKPDPTDPTDDPTKPVDPNGPVKPGDPTDPTNPVTPAGPTNPGGTNGGTPGGSTGGNGTVPSAGNSGTSGVIMLVPPATQIVTSQEEGSAPAVQIEQAAPNQTNLGNDETPLASLQNDCWIHWLVMVGMLMTAAYAAGVVIHRRSHMAHLKDLENYALGVNVSKNSSIGIDQRGSVLGHGSRI